VSTAAPPGRPLWSDTSGATVESAANRRLPLDRHLDADVAIVGAGYTGLWTAYYLARLDPSLRIVIVEAETVGFGASGRNGGWASALLPMSLSSMAEKYGRDGALRMHRAMVDTLDEIERVITAEGIDCHFHRGGTLQISRTAAHTTRLVAEVDEYRAFGLGDDHLRWLDAGEASSMIAATRVAGGTFTPHCAAIQPARLVHGLADAVERRGVVIHEHSAVSRIDPDDGRGARVVTDRGAIRAACVVRATEGFTATLRGLRRRVAPIYSLMIATEPLPQAFWDEVGWHERQTFADARHLVIYGQRTADDRIAFGGRGAPYHFGSRVDSRFDVADDVHSGLHHTLLELFPALGDATITHRWGGPIGLARDWHCTVDHDRATGLAMAGGYVGDGVSTTNLAGRTLADLITSTTSDLTDLPWVGHRSRSWEPEPLRWMGINMMVRLPFGADEYEQRTGRSERWRTALLARVTGH
jgi:glycine/D-amino acid oxidase-like deaminating enzyme